MQQTYRGYRIEANRKKCLAGYNLVYIAIFDPDDMEIESRPLDTDEPIRDIIRSLRKRVDNEIEKPTPPRCVACGRSAPRDHVKPTQIGRMCRWCRASTSRHVNVVKYLGGQPHRASDARSLDSIY